MNLEGIGSPIAYIVNKYDKTIKPRILYADDDKDKVRHYLTDYKCKVNEIIQPIPNTKEERQICYVTGKSGSGKSYWIALYANVYHKIYPNRPIFLFSSILEDKGSIDKIKKLKRVNIRDPKFLDMDFSIDDFKNMLLIFDDTDCISDKKLKAKVNSILDMALQTGRHTNTSVI